MGNGLPQIIELVKTFENGLVNRRNEKIYMISGLIVFKTQMKTEKWFFMTIFLVTIPV